MYISPAVGDAHLLEVAQFPDSAQVDKPMQFYIRLNGAKGSLDGRVSVKLTDISNDEFKDLFVPIVVLIGHNLLIGDMLSNYFTI